jgi:hypothetical protein
MTVPVASVVTSGRAMTGRMMRVERRRSLITRQPS